MKSKIKTSKNRIKTSKGIGTNMAYELSKASEEYDEKSPNNNKNVSSFLHMIQSNDKVLQHKKNDLVDLQKKNQNLKQALKTIPAASSSNNNNNVAFPETKVDGMNDKSDGRKFGQRKTMRSPSTATPADLIGRLQDQGDMFARKIEVEKRKIDDLQSKISTLLAKSADQRKKMGGINAARENQMAVNKRLKVLENRLDQAMIKYNESLSKNKHLREEINESRRQRLVYDSVYKKLEEELATKKHRMAKIIAESNRAYEVRDKLLLQLNDLKENVDKEQTIFETEWAKLGNAISVETGGRDARKRELERRDAEEEQEKLRKKAVGEEQRLKSKVLSGAWKIAKEKAHLALR
jgi:coiled-coil domain-containing protein 63/114